MTTKIPDPREFVDGGVMEARLDKMLADDATILVPVDEKLIEDSKAPPSPREPVVWADDVSPFTGDQVKALLDENEKLKGEASADQVPGIHFIALQNKYKALRALYDEQALMMAGRIAEQSRTNAELDAHRVALRQKGQTRTFDELMKLAQAGGARHLAFAVTLADYFPYPSPKDSWVCEAYETDNPISEPIAGGKGRSGEEALRNCVTGLPVKK